MSLKQFLATTALAATMATAPLLAPMAVAQDQQGQIDGAAIAADSDMVDAFIAAALAVNEVREGYMAQIEAEADQNAQMEILEAADAAMLEAVEETPGITLDEYIAIANAAAEDPELAARIDARFTEAHMGG
ncbi:DUF4168 domain-containing protein [Roseinatronobacter alkalisoli]|uniref:DUF4168 domain-containing protein n=1 Tax=Roseinatronobacter alkalisoli TaxID=3028235 RepID=A0ABT5T5C2_9RHOB|nr:DUF4168 domain-containing protein [Roseinatronobacter sp. HJB301]MDD7970320.1 DUF4168 domain-containing protein [Roseinatronobacter sp. HJB301]